MSVLQVVKRNGKKEPIDISKIQKQIAYACEGIQGVSPSMVEIAAQIQFYDGITTSDIDKLILHAMAQLINEEENPEINDTNYQYVAGRQRLAMLRKEVYGSYNVPRLYDIVKKNVEQGVYTSELLEWYTEDEWNKIDSYVDHSKDEQLAYAAIEQFVGKYLVQNRVTGQIYETPQVRYAIAAAVTFHAEQKDRIQYVKEFYKFASEGAFSIATPVLAGLGTKTKQFSSCVVIKTNDSLNSIFAAGEMVAKYSAKRAGIGFEMGRIRGLKSPIRGGEVSHTGITPFIKKWFADMRSCAQGGIRNSSITIWAPIWHIQFDDFIVLKNNKGTEENRVRHADYGVVLSAYFLNRFKNKQDITFFDPNEVPDLYEAYYRNVEEFNTLYEKYEKRKDLRKKVISAETVFKDWVFKERTDTGRIYLMYVDNVIKHTPFDTNEDPIYQSNLCLTGDSLLQVKINESEMQMQLEQAVALVNAGIKVEVLSYNEKLQMNEYKLITVAALMNANAEIYEIYDNATNKVIRCTSDHKIFTEKRGWIQAQDLKENDILKIFKNESVSIEVENTGIEITKLKIREEVYDITVEDNHNFFANDILVHNCAEILIPSKSFESINDEKGEIGLCTLSSNNIAYFKRPEDMKRMLYVLTRALNNILDYQDFLSIQSINHNKRFKPLGIGILNLAYWHVQRDFKYGSPEALAELKRWMEYQDYFLLDATVRLAEERGSCERSYTSDYAKGIFLWEKRAKGVNDLTDFTPNPDIDWEELRARMMKFGVANLVQTAVAPVESSSLVIPGGATNGIALPMALISVKESKDGSFSVVVPGYKKFKNRYQLLWEQPDCVDYIKTAAIINVYTGQSISTDTFYSPKHFPNENPELHLKIPGTLIAKNLMLGHYWGIKTFYYSLMEKTGARDKEEKEVESIETDFEDAEECSACIL